MESNPLIFLVQRRTQVSCFEREVSLPYILTSPSLRVLLHWICTREYERQKRLRREGVILLLLMMRGMMRTKIPTRNHRRSEGDTICHVILHRCTTGSPPSIWPPNQIENPQSFLQTRKLRNKHCITSAAYYGVQRVLTNLNDVERINIFDHHPWSRLMMCPTSLLERHHDFNPASTAASGFSDRIRPQPSPTPLGISSDCTPFKYSSLPNYLRSWSPEMIERIHEVRKFRQ